MIQEKQNKYGNRKTIVNGKLFDSKKEAERYTILLQKQENREISELECQKEFELIPTQHYRGKTYRKCCYYADFYYKDKNGSIIVEDVKGFSRGRFSTETTAFRIKRKLLLLRYGDKIDFRIV